MAQKLYRVCACELLLEWIWYTFELFLIPCLFSLTLCFKIFRYFCFLKCFQTLFVFLNLLWNHCKNRRQEIENGRQRFNWHITRTLSKLRNVGYAHILETVILDQRRKRKIVKLSLSFSFSGHSFNYSDCLIIIVFGKNHHKIGTSNNIQIVQIQMKTIHV